MWGTKHTIHYKYLERGRRPRKFDIFHCKMFIILICFKSLKIGLASGHILIKYFGPKSVNQEKNSGSGRR